MVIQSFDLKCAWQNLQVPPQSLPGGGGGGGRGGFVGGGGRGHLGSVWVGMCRPGLQIRTPFWKKFPLKLIPRSSNGPIFDTLF